MTAKRFESETVFQSVAAFYRKNFLRWIDQAKRPVLARLT